MSGPPVVTCPAGVWTRIYQFSATFGVVYVTLKGPPSPAMKYREYSASPPFYLENTATFGSAATMLFVGPSPYVELWVNPKVSTSIFVSGT
jgi:hypothetical protein